MAKDFCCVNLDGDVLINWPCVEDVARDGKSKSWCLAKVLLAARDGTWKSWEQDRARREREAIWPRVPLQ